MRRFCIYKKVVWGSLGWFGIIRWTGRELLLNVTHNLFVGYICVKLFQNHFIHDKVNCQSDSNNKALPRGSMFPENNRPCSLKVIFKISILNLFVGYICVKLFQNLFMYDVISQTPTTRPSKGVPCSFVP